MDDVILLLKQLSEFEIETGKSIATFRYHSDALDFFITFNREWTAGNEEETISPRAVSDAESPETDGDQQTVSHADKHDTV